MIPGHCRHWNGIMVNSPCALGRDIDKFRTNPSPYERACFGDKGAPECAKYDTFTEAEIEADDKSFKEFMDKTLVARKAIVDHIDETGVGAGTIRCPVCEQDESLKFHQSQSNRHIHARCKTDGCVRWQE